MTVVIRVYRLWSLSKPNKPQHSAMLHGAECAHRCECRSVLHTGLYNMHAGWQGINVSRVTHGRRVRVTHRRNGRHTNRPTVSSDTPEHAGANMPPPVDGAISHETPSYFTTYPDCIESRRRLHNHRTLGTARSRCRSASSPPYRKARRCPQQKNWCHTRSC